MNRQREFEEQLERGDRRVVHQLLNDQKWSWLKLFYQRHFDEVRSLLNGSNLRTVVEDFGYLEPALKTALVDNQLFVYMINTAIYNGVLKRVCFE